MMAIETEEMVYTGKGTAVADPHMPKELRGIMEKQGYHFVGKHSAIKSCGYTISSMKNGGKTCYKHQFYGIRSWRCMQSTPAIGCNLSCAFCWRIIPDEIGIDWNELNALGSSKWDDPDSIVEGLIAEHRKLVSGFKGDENVDMKRWLESRDPAHVALSLTGEPLFYPMMSKLLDAFHRRGISTFLVTNGTMVNALKALTSLPTQLYVSVQAPDENVYAKTVRPKSLNASWDNFNRFIEIFSTLNTRRVFRLTLVKDLNMINPEGYAALIRKGNPHYVEVKGFSFIGGARGESRGLAYSSMPLKEEILDFAKRIADASGYVLKDYHEHSKVALLCRDEEAYNNRILEFDR